MAIEEYVAYPLGETLSRATSDIDVYDQAEFEGWIASNPDVMWEYIDKSLNARVANIARADEGGFELWVQSQPHAEHDKHWKRVFGFVCGEEAVEFFARIWPALCDGK